MKNEKFKNKEFNLFEAYFCLQLCVWSYLSEKEQKQLVKNNKLKNFKSFSKENTYAFSCVKDGTMYIVFRGSDMNDMDDIMDNLDIEKSKEGQGNVHAGYKHHLDRVWPRIKKYIGNKKPKRIVVTGHSLGGAVGQIASYRLSDSIGYYFGSARSVDSIIYKNNKSRVYQIQNEYDIVTNLPPKLFFDFRLLGEKYVLKYGNLYPRTQKISELLYSIFYMIAFFIVKALSFVFRFNDGMRNLLLKNHQIIYYDENLKAYVIIYNDQ